MGKNRKVAKPEPKRKVYICRHVHSLAFPPFDFLDFCWMLLSWMMCLKTAQAPSTNEKITKKLTSQLWCLNSKPKRKSQKVEKGLAFHFCFFFVQMSFQLGECGDGRGGMLSIRDVIRTFSFLYYLDPEQRVPRCCPTASDPFWKKCGHLSVLVMKDAFWPPVWGPGGLWRLRNHFPLDGTYISNH